MRALFIIVLLFVFLLCGCSDSKDTAASSVISGSHVPVSSPASSDAASSVSPGSSAAASLRPGDYSLKNITEAAEMHLVDETFEDIPDDELKTSFLSLYEADLKVRGRRNANNAMYVVFKKQMGGSENLSDILGGAFTKEAETYGSQTNLLFLVQIDTNYGVAAFGQGEISNIIEAVTRSYTGEYINKYL